MSKKVLVTGGAGFIGSHLTDRLLKQGWWVTVVDNFSHYYDPSLKQKNLRQASRSPRLKVYRLDIRNLDKLKKTFQGQEFRALVHLASEVGVRPSFVRADDYIATNIKGTCNLWQLGEVMNFAQFIFGSSSSVYGKRSGKRAFVETDPPAPISVYAATKRAAELVCEVYAKKLKVKTTVLRFFTVYGPRNRPDMAAFKFAEAISKNQKLHLFGNGTQRDFTYIDDIVDGIVAAINTPLSYEVVNLGSSTPVPVVKLIGLLEKTLGKKAKIIKQVLPVGDVPLTFANIAKAKQLLNWQPKTKLEAGVKQLVAWYKTVT